jgi:hypothetical protein
MLVMSHDENTFNKDSLRINKSPFIKKTNLSLDDFIKDPNLRAHFSVKD